MRTVIAGLLAGIFISLLVISFQLRTITSELNRIPALAPSSYLQTAAPGETREQRNERLQHNQRELEKDVQAIWATPSEPSKKPPVTPR